MLECALHTHGGRHSLAIFTIHMNQTCYMEEHTNEKPYECCCIHSFLNNFSMLFGVFFSRFCFRKYLKTVTLYYHIHPIKWEHTALFSITVSIYRLERKKKFTKNWNDKCNPFYVFVRPKNVICTYIILPILRKIPTIFAFKGVLDCLLFSYYIVVY